MQHTNKLFSSHAFPRGVSRILRYLKVLHQPKKSRGTTTPRALVKIVTTYLVLTTDLRSRRLTITRADSPDQVVSHNASSICTDGAEAFLPPDYATGHHDCWFHWLQHRELLEEDSRK